MGSDTTMTSRRPAAGASSGRTERPAAFWDRRTATTWPRPSRPSRKRNARAAVTRRDVPVSAPSAARSWRPGCEPRKPVQVMSRQEEIFRRYEKLAKAARKKTTEGKPESCAHCPHSSPDFKYRQCQFAKCPYGMKDDVFRWKPLRRDKFSGDEVVRMNG